MNFFVVAHFDPQKGSTQCLINNKKKQKILLPPLLFAKRCMINKQFFMALFPGFSPP